MAKAFALLGLLRLRHMQEEQAGAALAQAHGRARENANIDKRARRNLAEFGSETTSTEALRAIAAGRAAASAMLSELTVLGQTCADEVAVAQADFAAARSKSVGLEKLEARHGTAEAASDQRVEQNALDEIASASTTRKERTL